MHALSLPTSSGQIAFLVVTLAGFIAFAITLFSVSFSVTLGASAAEKPVERNVAPAQRAPSSASTAGS